MTRKKKIKKVAVTFVSVCSVEKRRVGAGVQPRCRYNVGQKAALAWVQKGKVEQGSCVVANQEGALGLLCFFLFFSRPA